MAKWNVNFTAAFNRAFPERQIYHRSGGTVRYISVSPWQQAIMACAALAVVGWTLFATGSYVLGGATTGVGNADQRELAKYERWVQELRAKDALSRSLLEERTDAFQKATVSWEDRHRALEDLLEKLKGDEDLEISALKGPNAKLLVRASIEEADSRQSREGTMMTASLGAVGTRAKINAQTAAQEKFLNQAEDIAVERAERARGVLKLTSVGSDRILSGSEMGGPLMSAANFTSSTSGKVAAFDVRTAQVAARVEEARYYEKIVSALPLGPPVGDTFRITSPYGLRVDPFNKRPGWHGGVDMGAYRNAPIIASGPGVISFAGTRSGYGRLVEIDHGHGFKSRYGHLRRILVKKGDTVTIGHDIGKMGTTGRSTGDHLHFEVWFQGKPYDPQNFLKAGRHVHKE